MNLQELEKLAEQSLDGKSYTRDKDTLLHGETSIFEMSLGISIRDRLMKLIEKNPGESILVADIGGGSGGLAGAINKHEGIEAFCIDISPRIPLNATLPKNRFIKANAESMPEIASETFHYLISFNAMTYTDISKSVPEAYRILKQGGLADFDWEFSKEEQLIRLKENEIFKYISFRPGFMTTIINIHK